MVRSVLLIILASTSIFPFSCSVQQPIASDFNILFKYGVTLKNELDTFNNTYTKDMVTDPPITVNFVLTSQEKQKIHDKMVEIDFFEYPDEFIITVPPGQTIGQVTPYSRYYFHVEYDSKKKDLSWDDNIIISDSRADKLRELIQLIQIIIEVKDEYKKLPTPSGGYL